MQDEGWGAPGNSMHPWRLWAIEVVVLVQGHETPHPRSQALHQAATLRATLTLTASVAVPCANPDELSSHTHLPPAPPCPSPKLTSTKFLVSLAIERMLSGISGLVSYIRTWEGQDLDRLAEPLWVLAPARHFIRTRNGLDEWCAPTQPSYPGGALPTVVEDDDLPVLCQIR